MTTADGRCSACGLESGALTCAPGRALAFAIPFALAALALVYALGAWLNHTPAAVTVSTSVAAPVVVGALTFRMARSSRLDLTGTECHVTITNLAAQFTWADITAVRRRRTIMGTGRRMLLRHGVVLRSQNKTRTRPGITVFDADLRKASAPVRAHLEHILETHAAETHAV